MVIAPPHALIVKEQKADTITPGGIELPDSVANDLPYHIGEVISGSMWPPSGAVFPPRAAIGEEPLCDPMPPMPCEGFIAYYRGGFSFKHEGEEYMYVAQNDLLAVGKLTPEVILAVE